MIWYKDLYVGESIVHKTKKGQMEDYAQCRTDWDLCDHISL